MTDTQTIINDAKEAIATARDDFAKQRVNRAVDGILGAMERLIAVVELTTEASPTPAKNILVEPAPAPKGEVVAETVPETVEGNPDAQDAPAKPKRAKGTRSNDVAATPGSITVA